MLGGIASSSKWAPTHNLLVPFHLKQWSSDAPDVLAEDSAKL